MFSSMRRVLSCLLALGLLVGCSSGDDSSSSDDSSSDDSPSDEASPAEMLAQLDSAQSESAYEGQLARLAAACGMTPIAVADLAVHAANNVAPENGVDVSISEMLDAIESNAGKGVSCDEVAAATITLMMG